MPLAVSWMDAAFSKWENNIFLKELSCDVNMQFAMYRITSSSVRLKYFFLGLYTAVVYRPISSYKRIMTSTVIAVGLYFFYLLQDIVSF